MVKTFDIFSLRVEKIPRENCSCRTVRQEALEVDLIGFGAVCISGERWVATPFCEGKELVEGARSRREGAQYCVSIGCFRALVDMSTRNSTRQEKRN